MAGSIEFVEEPDAGYGEDTRRPRPARRPNPWLVVVALAAVAAGVVFALTRSSQPPPVRPAAAPSSAGDRSSVGVPDHPLGTPSPSSSSRCGAAPFCAVSLTVPRPVGAALHRRVPRIGGLRVESAIGQSLATGASYLAYRVISVDNRAIQLKITVHRLIGPADPPEATALGVVHVRVLTDAFVVDALSYPTSDGVLAVRALRALAADPRLELI